MLLQLGIGSLAAMPVPPDAKCNALHPQALNAKGGSRGSPSCLPQQGPAHSAGRIETPGGQVPDHGTIIRRLVREERSGRAEDLSAAGGASQADANHEPSGAPE